MAKVTCLEFRQWMENDDDELVDDPEMGHHLDVCKECSDWLDLTIAILERARLPALMALYGLKFQLQ